MRALLRRPFVASLASAALVAFVVACAPFGASDADTELGVDAASSSTMDGSLVDAPPSSDDGSSDAQVVDGPAGPPGPGTCLDFTTGTHGVSATGATHGADGYELEIRAGATSSIRKLFAAPTNVMKITRSVVTVVASASLGGAWQDGAYADIMAQYLGDSVSYTAAPAMELEAMKAKLELNVWHAANNYDRAYPIALATLPTKTSIFRLSTAWAAGTSTLDVGDTEFPLTTKQTTASATHFTVVVGGKTYNGGTPTIALTVKMLCVDLQ